MKPLLGIYPGLCPTKIYVESKGQRAVISSNQSLKNYGFIWHAIFFTLCMCTKHLAAKCDYYSKNAELELQLHVCTKTGSLVHPVFEQSLHGQ